MTRRSSVRALARENYCALAEEAGQQAQESIHTPYRSPYAARGGGEQRAGAGGEKNAPSATHVETELTARVRKLYEESAVPVREIAAIAGVSERTIYKYVEKYDWKKRYRVLPRGEEAARANVGRHMEPSSDFGAELVPVKGVGGRFIRRADRDSPVATGLKATDPAGAKRAAAGCGDAAHLSALVQAEAKEAQRFERQIRANHAVGTALKNLREYREECGRNGNPADGGRIEPILIQLVEVSLRQCEALLPEIRTEPRGKIHP